MAPSDHAGSPADVKRHPANWQDEIDSAALCNALADLDGDPRLADVYRRLGASPGPPRRLLGGQAASRRRPPSPSDGRAGAHAC